MELEPKLVGRDSEIEEIIGHLGEALKGSGSLVLISGEAGVGKTRVLNAVVSMARGSGFQILIGRCIPGTSCPYLPFYEAFSTFLDGPFKELSQEVAYPSNDPSTKMFKVLDFLTHNSETRPMLLCLEDLHWADSVTDQLLHFLARNIRNLRTAIIGTYRTEDIAVEVGKEEHPLRGVLHTMIREGIVDEVHLDRIEEPLLTEAVESMLGAPLSITLAHNIAKESGGNPLFAVETVRMLMTTGGIELRDGRWALSDAGQVKMPSTVHEVIIRRLEGLPKEYRRILECASVMGEYFDPIIISQTLSLDRMLILEVLDSLCTRFHLVQSMEVVYGFEHEKIREVSYEEISTPRRKELHYKVGIALEERMPDERLYGTLSNHFHLSGQMEKSFDYSIRAGEYLYRNSGGSEAEAFFRRAVEDMSKCAGNDEKRIRALLGLGDCYHDRLAFISAEKAYMQGLTIASEHSQQGKFLWRLARCYRPVSLGNGETSQAWRFIERAELTEGLDDLDLASTYNEMAMLQTFEDRLAEADKSYLRAEEVMFRTGRTDLLGDILDAHANLLLAQQRVSESFHMEERALSFLSRNKSPMTTLRLESNQAELCTTKGEEEEALEHFAVAEVLATKLGQDLILFGIHYSKAMILEMNCDYEGARAESIRALEVAQRFEMGVLHAKACATLSRFDFMIGRINEAETLLERVRRLTEGFEWKIKTPARGMILLAQAMDLGMNGRIKECLALSDDALEILGGGMTNPTEEALIRQTLGIFLDGLGERGRALKELKKAKEVFLSYGNIRQAKRLDSILNSFTCDEKEK